MQLASQSHLPSRVPVLLLYGRVMHHMTPLTLYLGHSVTAGAMIVADLLLLGMPLVGAYPICNVFSSVGARVVTPEWTTGWGETCHTLASTGWTPSLSTR